MRIGILGAGAVGAALAELMAGAGHAVMVRSRYPERLSGTAEAAGCAVGTVEEACAFGDACLAALPLGALPLEALGDIPAAPLAGKVVMDAMNYCPERDGVTAALDDRTTTTSEIVARHLAGARVVRSFNAVLARDLPGLRRALAAATRGGELPHGSWRR